MERQLIANKYDTDKDQNYLDNYHEYFHKLRNEKINILEVGVLNGGSLLMWEEYFQNANIIGIDINPIRLIKNSDRVSIYQLNQTDTEGISNIARQHAPSGFDIIIDDASHNAYESKITFWHCMHNHLKSGGIYVIEDWGTGYWDTWYDGEGFKNQPDSEKLFPSHSSGMVGFVKQLIDEVGMGDISKNKPENKSVNPRKSLISKIIISHGQCFVFKK